jgi:hypothetical protein
MLAGIVLFRHTGTTLVIAIRNTDEIDVMEFAKNTDVVLPHLPNSNYTGSDLPHSHSHFSWAHLATGARQPHAIFRLSL